jgi:hypothetical protein
VNANLIPIVIIRTFCATIAFVIKVIVEARSRVRLLQSTPPELAFSILATAAAAHSLRLITAFCFSSSRATLELRT